LAFATLPVSLRTTNYSAEKRQLDTKFEPSKQPSETFMQRAFGRTPTNASRFQKANAWLLKEEVRYDVSEDNLQQLE
jgi:hypothetical protein